jgi:acyl-coenzyme A synthetase/AMP-(fatty) acid ligase/thioesterase domain-containing protein/acyl carrier protein
MALNLLPERTSVVTPEMNFQAPMAEGPSYAQQKEIRVRIQHPTGRHLPLSEEEQARPLLERWVRVVNEFGENVAVEDANRKVTYAEVNLLSNRVAHALVARRGSTAEPVALLFETEVDMPIGALAVWKAGKFYTWIEPSQPLQRTQFMIEDAGISTVITNRKYLDVARQLWPNAADCIVIDDLDEELPTEDLPVSADTSLPAFLMYTSGTTGKPKGTLELQRNLLLMMTERQEPFRYSNQDRIALLVPGSGSINTIVAAFFYGACLLPFQSRDEGLTRLSQWLIDSKVTVVIGGAVMRSWLMTLDGSQHFPDLRVIALGAGPMFREHVEAYQRYLPQRCVASNFYSATEVRSVSILLIDKGTQLGTRLVPTGFSPPWVKIEIWDEEGNPQPSGVTGEIVVFTPYAAAGYWQAPELTAIKFGVDAQGRRFCRMGDLGRVDENQCLEVLGRKDGQVKIRGNRVETAEVEVALLELGAVREVAVIAPGESDEARVLVAFVAADDDVMGNELRHQLATWLPSYMVPASIVILDELPRNANGKVARPLLHEMVKTLAFSVPEREFVFASETERRVAMLLGELLPGGSVGPDDNFFDVGGHSLLAAQLMVRIHQTFGVDLPPRDFFAEPTVAALARSIDRILLGDRGVSDAPTVRSTGIDAVQVVTGKQGYRPFFLMPGANGSLQILMQYQELFRRMGNQWPIYGLVTNTADDQNALFATLDELVWAALVTLRRIQPEGPYLIGGECLGGKLAFEMARVLVQEGEQVNLLLLDAPLRARTTKFAWGQKLLVTGVGRSLHFMQQWGNRIQHHWHQACQLGWREGRQYAVERLAALSPNSQSEVRQLYLARRNYLQLLNDFEPTQPYAHAVTVILSEHRHRNQPSWGTLTHDVQEHIVPGNHLNYLQVSGEKVAAKVRDALAAVHGTRVPALK